MTIALLQNDKAYLSFDLKDLLWLILVVGVWATQDYRIQYTNNVLKWNGELQEKIGQQQHHVVKANAIANDVIDKSLDFALNEVYLLDALKTDTNYGNLNSMSLRSLERGKGRMNVYLQHLAVKQRQLAKDDK